MPLRQAVPGRGRAPAVPLSDPLARVVSRLTGQGGSAQTRRAALFAFTVRVLSAGIAYLSQVLLARWMGSFEYGIFVFVWIWVLILGGLAPLGLSTTGTRFVPEYRETGRLALLRGLLRHARLVTLGASTGLALAGFAALYLFSGTVADYYLLPAFLILFCLPMYALEDVQDGMARGYGWMGVALVPPYILRPLFLLLAMLAAWGLGLEMTAATAAGAAILATWAAAIIQTVQFERRVAADMGPGPRVYRTGLWLGTSLPLLLVHGFELLLQNTDVLVLSHYVGPSQVGVYFAALKTIGLVSFVHFAVGAASAGRFSAHKAKGEAEALQAAVRDAVAWTFWPSLAGAALLLLLGKQLLWLFGVEFTSGYPVMFVLAAGLVVRAAMGPVEFILNMLGQQKVCAAALSATAALNLALNFALIPSFGLMGAAVATAVAMSAGAGAMALMAYRRLGLNCCVLMR